MSLPEGSLIVFSRGLRHIAQDSRKAVLDWLTRMPNAPDVATTVVQVGQPAIPAKASESGRYW
jgi:hypothetical protein